MLTTMRIIVVIAAGTVAFGQLEAARVYTAPTLLIVNGIGGFLFATYAIDKHKPLGALLRKADIGARRALRRRVRRRRGRRRCSSPGPVRS